MQPPIQNIEVIRYKKNLRLWAKVQIWPDISNIKMNDI